MSNIELIRIKTSGSEKTISFSDVDINDFATAREIGGQLAELFKTDDCLAADSDLFGQTRLNVDFKHISRLNSAGLNELIRMHTQARSHGVQLVLVDVQEAVRDVFVVTRIERMFEFSPSRDVQESLS